MQRFAELAFRRGHITKNNMLQKIEIALGIIGLTFALLVIITIKMLLM
jgi:hypothetical protein